MPVGDLLILVGNVEQAVLAEVRADQLHADGQAVDLAARVRQRRNAGQVDADGVDIRQVHLHGVAGLFAELEGGARRGRAGDDVALLEGCIEVVGDQTANALCLQIVGVVVTVRQHVGADENAALYFFAKTLRTRLGVHVVEVVVFRCAIAITHAVETRQVRAGFGRGDHVVGGDRLADRRQRNFNSFCTQLAVFGECGVDRGHGGRVAVGVEEFLRQTDA